MRSFAIAIMMLVPLAACTTPKSPEEARAQMCRRDVSDCEQRIRNCQNSTNELVCKDQDAYCKDVRARCPGY